MADNQFLALLEKDRPRIEPLIAPYFDKELWFNNAKAIWNAIQRDEKLRACSPQSLVNCVEEAARRGLEIGGPNKHCAPVAFKSTAILITQWQGKAFIWMKSGAIRKLTSQVVYEGDKFEIYQGDEDRIVHSPNLIDDRPAAWQNNIKNIVGAYAIATLWSGERVHSFVNRAYMVRLMEWVKKKNQGSLGFGYQDWLPEMCMKTAVHRLDGKIQPPPHMDPEQIAAWQRASLAPSVDADFEHVAEELPPDDLPSATVSERVTDRATESDPAGTRASRSPAAPTSSGASLQLRPDKPAKAGSAAVPSAASAASAATPTIDDADETMLRKIWRSKHDGKVAGLDAWLMENYEIEDLSELTTDKVAHALAKMEEL